MTSRRSLRSACLTLSLMLATTVQGQSSAAIDADVWGAIKASVVHDDIAAMGRTYHPDAVLVSNSGTRLIRQQLDKWGQDMVANKAKGIHATVEFRFTARQDDAETAFEAGVFRYTVTDKAGVSKPSYVRMEALLTRKGGKWQIVMERQLDAVTAEAWDAMKK